MSGFLCHVNILRSAYRNVP